MYFNTPNANNSKKTPFIVPIYLFIRISLSLICTAKPQSIKHILLNYHPYTHPSTQPPKVHTSIFVKFKANIPGGPASMPLVDTVRQSYQIDS